MGEQSNGRRFKVASLIVAMSALLAVHVLWASHFWTGAYLALRYAMPMLSIFGLATLAWFAPGGLNLVRTVVAKRSGKFDRTNATYSPSLDYNRLRYGVGEYLLVVVAVVATVASFVGVAVKSYETDVRYRISALEFTTDPSPSFEARFPYAPANALMGRSVGDAENVKVSDAGFTDPSQGQWASMVSGNGLFRPSLGVVVKTDAGFVRCDWPESDAGGLATVLGDGGVGARSGWWGNDLGRQLRQVKRNTSIDWSGLGAWCGEDGPWVVIPSTRPVGLFRTHQVPAGAWVIDPKGEISFVEDAEQGAFPVPVVSPEIARQVVDANLRVNRDGQPAGWRSILPSNRVGLERPESRTTDSENPDRGNAGEFLLVTGEGRRVYVTALTPVGDSETVVALAVVYTDETTSGGMPRTVIHRLPEDLRRRSNAEIVALLRTTYDREVQWEAGYRLFELAPLADGVWSATIGQALEVKYRALLYPDGSSCLTLFESGEVVQCSGEGSSSRVPVERIPGQGLTDLGLLSDAELLDLLDSLVAELRSR